ncbi:hypothetical protein GCM10018785_70010 [Streptomyces longispororuber]|uniref:Uncharacterized protein n=1 Tax=Streptomyces longispororuber TaxID=68230 RepID=A0A919DXA6_9ACTN|nr:hypothetical protein GCM10018785_70010 [Streptomyces longispororuber]
MGEMGLDRGLADEQLIGGAPVGRAPGDECEHFPFAGAQRLVAGGTDVCARTGVRRPVGGGGRGQGLSAGLRDAGPGPWPRTSGGGLLGR